MPTTRRRIKRTRIGAPADIAQWIRWHCGIALYIPSLAEQNPWKGQDARRFWKQNKQEIMRTYMEQKREKNEPFKRPKAYLAELERKHPRKVTGQRESWTHWDNNGAPKSPTIEFIYETDEEYLTRLGLLESWEVEK